MDLLRDYFYSLYPQQSQDFIESLVLDTWFDTKKYFKTLETILTTTN